MYPSASPWSKHVLPRPCEVTFLSPRRQCLSRLGPFPHYAAALSSLSAPGMRRHRPAMGVAAPLPHPTARTANCSALPAHLLRLHHALLLDQKFERAVAASACGHLEHAGLLTVGVDDRTNAEALEQR